jgi:hypothetical protein
MTGALPYLTTDSEGTAVARSNAVQAGQSKSVVASSDNPSVAGPQAVQSDLQGVLFLIFGFLSQLYVSTRKQRALEQQNQLKASLDSADKSSKAAKDQHSGAIAQGIGTIVGGLVTAGAGVGGAVYGVKAFSAQKMAQSAHASGAAGIAGTLKDQAALHQQYGQSVTYGGQGLGSMASGGGQIVGAGSNADAAESNADSSRRGAFAQKHGQEAITEGEFANQTYSQLQALVEVQKSVMQAQVETARAIQSV